MLKPTLFVALLVVLSGGTPGCGGGGGGGSGDTTVFLASDPALDGWTESDGGFSALPAGPLTGDFDNSQPGVGFRQLYSFDLAGVPTGATIVSATLQLYQATVGGNPYGELGSVIVDHVDYGAALDGGDYAGGTLSPNVGTLSTDGLIEYKSLDVTAEVQADVNFPRSRSQFRIQFSPLDTNNDGFEDYAQFTDAEDSCCGVNQPPILVVTFE